MTSNRRVFLSRQVVIVEATALVLLLTAAAAWLWAHEGHQALPTRGASVDTVKGLVALGPEARKALDVRVADITLLTLDDEIAAPVTIVAPWQRHAFVSTRLPGKVTELHVRPGEAISKGQLVAEVESLELVDLQREFVDAYNDSQLTAKNLAAVEIGSRRASMPEKDLRDMQVLNQQNKIALDVSRRKLFSLGVPDETLNRLIRGGDAKPLKALPVNAPFAGVAIHVDVGISQIVDPGYHLLEVVDLSKVWMKIGVLEKDLHRIAVGQSVAFRLPAAPGPSSGGLWSGIVQVKGNYLDPQTHWGVAWAEIENPQGILRPGMAGQARVRVPAAREGLLVPSSALVTAGAERYVFVETGPGQYRRQNVIVEQQRANEIQVSRSAGLFPGDRVVTAGSHELAAFFVQGVLRLSPEAERGIGLRVEPAARRSVADTITLGAIVDLPPNGRAIVSPRLAGTLRRIAVDRDQVVRAGEIIAEVESLELQNIQLDYLRNYLQCQMLEERVDQLRKAEDVVPERMLREIENAFVTARERRDSLRHKLRDVGLSDDQVQAILAKQTIIETVPVRASINGTIVRFQATLGQAVKAEDPLFEIHDLSSVTLRVDVPEAEVSSVRVGMKGQLRFVADPAYTGEAVVARSGEIVGPSSRTAAVWAELKGVPKTPLLMGMMARLTLRVSEPPATLSVPVKAVLHEGISAYLFVRQKDGSFERRSVETGRSDDQFVQIFKGLSEGELVAVHGVADLQTAYASIQ